MHRNAIEDSGSIPDEEGCWLRLERKGLPQKDPLPGKGPGASPGAEG